MDIRATGANGRQLIITLSDLTSDPVTNGVTTEKYIPMDDVMTGTENSFLFTILDGTTMVYSFITGSLDITSCDAKNKQVSGTFSFSDDEFQVTNGSFTNMCYTVLK